MKKKKNQAQWSRRDFLSRTGGTVLIGAIGCGAGCNARCSAQAPPQDTKTRTGSAANDKPTAIPGKRSKVVLIRDQNVLSGGRQVNASILSRMLDEGVMALLSESEPSRAWDRLVTPDDTVGIKSNVWRFLATPPELEQAISDRVFSAGVPSNQIGIDDRGVLRNPIFQNATALINVRPMRTHHWSGVGSCIKNYIVFSPRPSSWHSDSCADLAGLWELPEAKGKTRLNVLVMLTPLFHGKGPHHFNPRYTWEYGGLIIGEDPVAVDAIGVRILEAKRRDFFDDIQPLVVPPKHIAVAEEKFGLGVADPDRIDVVKLGWESGALI